MQFSFTGSQVLEINSLGHRKRIMASLKKEAKKKEREEPLEVSQDHLKPSGGKTDGLIDLLGWLNN